MRCARVITLLTGVALMLRAVSREHVAVLELVVAFLLVVISVALIFGNDVLADHPADEEEERRRRGAAGWQKPVRPPASDARPGGLPWADRRED